jgi:hypothetical protein
VRAGCALHAARGPSTGDLGAAAGSSYRGAVPCSPCGIGAITGALCAASISLSPAPASAGVFDVEGFGPEGIAAINARAARADDGTAAFYNPGGLGLGRGVAVSIAPQIGASTLTAQGVRRPLDDPFGVGFALAATIPLEGPLHDRLRVGIGGYFPFSGLLHLLARPIDQPLFPYYDNRTQRLELMPALAFRITDRLAIGAAVNILGGVTGTAAVLPSASGALESRIDLTAGTVAAANLGLRFDPTEHVHLAVTFHQHFAIPVRITTTAEIGGEPLQILVSAASALFDPATLVIAGSVERGPLTVEIDAAYVAWSAYVSPFVEVSAALPGLNLASDLPKAPTRDIVSLRGAAAYRILLTPAAELTLHAGLGAEPRMLKGDLQGRSNLLDGDKALFGLGAALALPRLGLPFVRALRVSAGLGAQAVFPFAQTKHACEALPCPPGTVAGPDATAPSVGITNPGFPRLEGGGAFFAASFGIAATL